jgi:hypothetical protein
MFAGDGISLFQDVTSPGATFDIGKAYVFTIAAGGNSGLPNGAQLRVRLYYRDGSNAKVTVAVSTYLYDPLLDPGSINFLYDYSVNSLVVNGSDAWAGKGIGIEISTPGPTGGSGAYWDLDNARLAVVPEPASLLLLVSGIAALSQSRRRRPHVA